MDTIRDAVGDVIWQVGREITEDTVAGLGAHDPRRRLVGAVVDWYATPVSRCIGDDHHWPARMPDGKTVMVSKRLGYYSP